MTLAIPCRDAASTANHTISSVLPCRSVTIGVIPQAMASWRAVRGRGVAATIGTRGRKREMARGVRPELVQATMAVTSASAEARHAAAEIAAVI